MVSLVHSSLDYGNFVFVGLPSYLQRRLQTVLNAAARLVFRLRRYEHVSDALAILHWLRLPERVNFKQALTANRVLNGMAPPYLNQQFVPVSSLPGRRRLQSSFTLQLHIPQYRLSTAGRRSFPVAASHFLEHSAKRRAVCNLHRLQLCIFLPATAKDILVSQFFSGLYSFPYYVDFATA